MLSQKPVSLDSPVIVDGPWGKVSLAHPRWTVQTWAELEDPADKRHVYMCHASLPYFFHHIVLPYESEIEGLPCPEVLPAFMDDALLSVQAISKYGVELERTGIIARKPPQYQLCYLVPMGHFKTTMMVVGSPLWFIARDPMVTMLIACPNVTFAADRVGRVVGHIESNERFINIFGDLRPTQKHVSWTSEEATVNRPKPRGYPTMRAFGTTSTTTSCRADLAFVDDAVTPWNVGTALQRQKTTRFVTSHVHNRLNADSRMIVVVGTSYHFDDTYQHLRTKAVEDGSWLFVRKAAVLNTDETPFPPPLPNDRAHYYPTDADTLDFSQTKVLWPDYWTPQRLFLDWLKGPYDFAAERQNEPVDPDTKIFSVTLLRDKCRADGGLATDGSRRPVLRAWSTAIGRPLNSSHWLWQEYASAGIDLAGARVIVSVDLAAGGEGRKTDYNVMELWVITTKGQRLLVDLWRKRGDPVRKCKPEFRAWVKAFAPDEVLFEANIFQRTVATQWSDDIGVPIKKVLMPRGRMDEFRGMVDIIDANLFFYAGATSACRKMMKPFEDEMDQFPDPSHDDTLAAAFHVYLHSKPDIEVRSRPARVRAIDLGQPSSDERKLAEWDDRSLSQRLRKLQGLVADMRAQIQLLDRKVD